MPVRLGLEQTGAPSADSALFSTSTETLSPTPMTTASDSAPLADIIAEARRLLDEAAVAGLPLRLLGGLAVALRVPPDATPRFPRAYKDIDFIVSKGTSARHITKLFIAAGYTEDLQFNAINGHRRLMYHDLINQRQCDIFIGTFSMCHEIALSDRIETEPDTIPLAELILTKLQVVELNDKDLRDILMLLYHHQLSDIDGTEAINVSRVAALCAADWGLWRTATQNVERAADSLLRFALNGDDLARLQQQLQALRSRIDAEPKSRKWKVRARVGDRIRWYEDVEEVG